MKKKDSDNALTIRERLILFLFSINESHENFCKKTGLSNGFLKQKKSCINSDKIFVIWKVYQDLNIEWLITGCGYMKKTFFYNSKIKIRLKGDEQVAELPIEKLIESQEEIIKCLCLTLGDTQEHIQNKNLEINILKKDKTALEKLLEKQGRRKRV